MFARLFRLSDRLGRLIVKISVRTGSWGARQIELAGRELRARVYGSALSSQSAQAEGQVRSLSGLVVMLLASVVLLIVWATGPQARASSVIRLFSVGGTPEPSSSEGQSRPLPPADGEPFLGMGGTVIFSMFAGAQEDLFALSAGQSEPLRLTDHPADDRDPAWSPDGQRIAFASRRDGNWDIYILDLATGEVTRLTYDPAFEAGPTWSPDGQWLAYEGYYNDNLDIYIIRADGGEGPYRVTYHPAPDFSPAWTTEPGGRDLAYVSWREGNQDIYILSLDDPSEDRAVNLTSTPEINENAPAWSPDGTLLAYSTVEDGVPLVYVSDTTGADESPLLVGQGQSPAWSPDGSNLIFTSGYPENNRLLSGQFGAWDTSVQAFALPSTASDPDWSGAVLPAAPQGSLAFAATAPIQPAYEEAILPPEGADGLYRLINIEGVVAEAPWLSDRVDDSFVALKDYVNQAAGWDFLGRLDEVWWPLDRPVEPGQDPRNWHKAGRAFDIAQAYNQGEPPQIELVPEQIGPDLYWRLYIRCALQDGSQGEPLRQLPWDFAARTSGDVAAYEAGGRYRDAIPSGYYVDFTRIAQVFGWQRVPSDSSWRYNWPGVLYWQYENHGGLDWWDAMLELYPEATLRQALNAPTPAPTVIPPTPSPPAVEETPTLAPTPTSPPAIRR